MARPVAKTSRQLLQSTDDRNIRAPNGIELIEFLQRQRSELSRADERVEAHPAIA